MLLPVRMPYATCLFVTRCFLPTCYEIYIAGMAPAYTRCCAEGSSDTPCFHAVFSAYALHALLLYERCFTLTFATGGMPATPLLSAPVLPPVPPIVGPPRFSHEPECQNTNSGQHSLSWHVRAFGGAGREGPCGEAARLCGKATGWSPAGSVEGRGVRRPQMSFGLCSHGSSE